MKKKSLGLLLAAALSFGAISPAQAQEVNAPVASETGVTAEQDTATNSQSSFDRDGDGVGCERDPR
ncbi:excalibur calcium-binding domain-containing protein [Corynebacterium striatum]|uniref:excalibur calcium-binding domain-containing protein n=1 Tax=Corynebacterium striatum TaxID=43770 RepID=UPI0027B9F1D7|nr:excalibur calcium-binding domain-containing protein [Corynebacterium striatum]